VQELTFCPFEMFQVDGLRTFFRRFHSGLNSISSGSG
jgi:hypothetical protein